MSDEHDHNDDDDGPEIHAFKLPASLQAMVARAAHEHDRAHMSADEFEVRVYDFLDGLNIDQLMILRRMLNVDQKSTTNNYFDGLCVGYLRIKYDVDPTTGLTPVEAAAQQEPKG